MTDRREHPLKWMVEVFSVLSGGVFLASGLLNGYAFWSNWKINYYMIAAPADVIMGAFVSMYLVLASFTLIAAVTAMSMAAVVAGETIVGLFRGGPVAGYFSLNPKHFWHRVRRKCRWLIMKSFSEFLILLRGPSAVRLGMLLCGFALFIVVGLFSSGDNRFNVAFWSQTGLRVSDKPGDNPCDGAPVLWLGSSAAILECRDGVRVIHDLDGIETVRRYR